MDINESLLQEVLDHAADDSPRLVYADWLEEQGDPLAEFIRLQCEIAQLPPFDDSVPELQVLESELLVEHETAWIHDLKEIAVTWTFRRGFVEFVEMSADDFLEHAESISSWAPIQSLHLTGVEQHIAGVAKCDFLSQLSGLTIEDRRLRDAGLVKLANSQFISKIERLVLSGCGLTNKGLVGLVNFSNMHNLKLLDLSQNTIRATGIQALVGSPLARNLEALLLSDNAIQLPSAKHLANSNYLRNLKYLDLRWNPIPNEGVELLRERFGKEVCEI